MAFYNALFPNPPMIHGLKRETIIPTQIVSNGNTEYRIRKNKFERYSWVYPQSTLTSTQYNSLKAFWVAVEGGLKSFLYQDPHKPYFINTHLINAGGSNWYLFNDEGHRIWHRSGLTVNTGSITGSGVNSSGEPYITVSGTNSGSTVIINGPMYFSARFDGQFEADIVALDVNNLPIGYQYDSIMLMEVFETTL